MREFVGGDVAVPLVGAVPAVNRGEFGFADGDSASVLVADVALLVGEAEIAGNGVVAAEALAGVVDVVGGEDGHHAVEVVAGVGEAEAGSEDFVVGLWVAVHDRAVAGRPDGLGDWFLVADLDHFVAALQRLRAVEPLGFGAGTVAPDALAVDVPAVALGVGHGPGDLGVVSVVDGAGVAGATGAGDGELGALHVHDVPLGRDAEGEMRVADDEGFAAGGVGAVDDPAVRAVESASAGAGFGFEIGERAGEGVGAVGPGGAGGGDQRGVGGDIGNQSLQRFDAEAGDDCAVADLDRPVDVGRDHLEDRERVDR